jgi:hypothetical protein
MRVTLPGFCLALPSSELLATVKRCAVVAVTATLAWSFLCACLPANAQVANWIDSWTASPQRGVMPTSFSNRTIRQIGHVSVGGTKVRLRLSNEFGRRPLLIGAASVALAGKGARTAAGSTRTVTFGGTKSIIIPPGAPMLSDPIELTVRPLSDVAVNLYLPAATDLATVHTTGLQTAYVSASGDYTRQRRISSCRPIRQSFFPCRGHGRPRDARPCHRSLRRFNYRWYRLDRECQLARRARATVEGRRHSVGGFESGHRRKSCTQRRRRRQCSRPLRA